MLEKINELVLDDTLEKLFQEYKHYSYVDIENNKNIFNEVCDIDAVCIYNKILNALDKKNYLIIRNFGTNLASLVSFVNFISSNNFFYLPKLDNAFISIFKMQNTNELSHTLNDGYFHTDYSLHPDTPNFITLQIIEKDPKFPYYSRNSIVLVSHIINFLEKNNKELLEFLSKVKLPVANSKRVVFQTILNIETKTIKFHEKLIRDGINKHIEYRKYLTLIDDFIVICNYLSIDFALDKGDLVIISNKTLLHKRSTASVTFDENNKIFKGRVVNSIRFY